MNCERYRRMLYLYRAGELSNRDAERLIQHLHSCESCRLEKERIDKVETIVRRVRSFTPNPDNPDSLTSSIMTRIRSSISQTSRSGLLDRLFDLFDLPQVRIASASFAVVAIGLFLFQYLTLFTDIHRLELSAIHRSQGTSTGVTYSVESKRVQELARSKELQALISPGQIRITDGQVLVHQSDITSFLSSENLRSLTTTIASSALRIDKKKLDFIITDILQNTKTITSFGH